MKKYLYRLLYIIIAISLSIMGCTDVQTTSAPYNLTNISTSENYLELTQNVNDMTSGLLGFLILLSFFIILIISFSNSSIAARITTAALLTTIVSFLFRVIGLTSDLIVLMFVITTATSFLVLAYRS